MFIIDQEGNNLGQTFSINEWRFFTIVYLGDSVFVVIFLLGTKSWIAMRLYQMEFIVLLLRNMKIVFPKVYTEESKWKEWIDHLTLSWPCVSGFISSKSNGYVYDCGGMLFKRLPEGTCNNFKQTPDDMQNWFKPESKKELVGQVMWLI